MAKLHRPVFFMIGVYTLLMASVEVNGFCHPRFTAQQCAAARSDDSFKRNLISRLLESRDFDPAMDPAELDESLKRALDRLLEDERDAEEEQDNQQNPIERENETQDRFLNLVELSRDQERENEEEIKREDLQEELRVLLEKLHAE